MPPKVRVKIPVHVFVYSLGFIPAAAYGERDVTFVSFVCLQLILPLDLVILLFCHSSLFLSNNHHHNVMQPTTGTKMPQPTTNSKRNFPKTIPKTYNHHETSISK
jgi:hypothetical protein